jgi:mannose-6-phosphate isomerase class I
LEAGLAAVKVKTASGKVVRPAPVQISGSNNRQGSLVAAPYFVVDMFEMKSLQELTTRDESGKSSVQILVAIEGCGVIEAPGAEPVTLAKGDAVVVPASIGKFTVRPQWAIEFLRSRVPGTPLPEPETRL